MRRLLALLVLAGCSPPPKQEARYVVVSSFNEVVLDTDDRERAYETAHSLTLLGRVLASKPLYFVLEGDDRPPQPAQ
jgi:hypothetical protein